jgi:ribosome maturation factor RimP
VAPSLADELIVLLEPLALDHGLELVTVEVAGGGRHQVVRVFLDRDGGIDIEAIAEANAWLSETLDGVSRLSGPYTLEVSSPGIERVVRKREDFARFAGRKIVLHTAAPIDGRSKFTGDLVGIEGDDVVLKIEEEQYRVPFDRVERARLKADFD